MRVGQSEIKKEFNKYLDERQKLINDLSDKLLLNINDEIINKKIVELLDEVVFFRSTINVDARLDEINKLVDRYVKTHNASNFKILESSMVKSYKYGFDFAGEDAKRQGRFLQDSFKQGVHEEAILASINNTYKDILFRTQYMNEYTKDIIRDFVRTEVDTIQATGQSFHSSAKTLSEKIQKEGLVIIDRGGNPWTETRYSNMVIQTKAMQMFRDGTGNRLRGNGILYVYIPHHAGACTKCGNHQGNIYFIGSNDSQNYLGAAYLPSPASNSIFHPHCRCTYSAWIEEYQDDDETTRLIKQGLKAN